MTSHADCGEQQRQHADTHPTGRGRAGAGQVGGREQPLHRRLQQLDLCGQVLAHNGRGHPDARAGERHVAKWGHPYTGAREQPARLVRLCRRNDTAAVRQQSSKWGHPSAAAAAAAVATFPQQPWIGQPADPGKSHFDDKTAVSEAMKFPVSTDEQLKWAQISCLPGA